MTLRPKRDLVPRLRALAEDLCYTAGEYQDLLKSVAFADGGDLLHQANDLARERKEEILAGLSSGRLPEVVRKQSEASGEGERERKLIIEDLYARMLPDIPGYAPEYYQTKFTRDDTSILLQNASHPLVIREFARHPLFPAVGLCGASFTGLQYGRAVRLLNALLSLITQGTLVARPASRPPPQEARIPALPLTRWLTFRRSSYVPDQTTGGVEPLAAGTVYLPPEILDEVERFVGPSTMTLSRRSRDRVRREDRAVDKKLVALSGRLDSCLMSPTAAAIRFMMRTPSVNSYYWGKVFPEERAAAIRRRRRQCCATSVSTGERCLRMFTGTLAGREPLCHSHTAQPRPVLAAPIFRGRSSLATRSSSRLRLRRLVSESRG